MKKIFLGLLLCPGVHAMEPDLENGLAAPTAIDIASKIATIIEQYDSTKRGDDQQFRSLVVSYFKKESIEIEARITPHLMQKLRNSNSAIDEILKNDDRKALEELVHKLITESVEDAFQDQTDRFAELKDLADGRLRKARYAMVTAIATGVLGVLGTFLGVFFGKS